MLNYIKGECYRMRVQSGFYIMAGVLCALVLIMNIVLALFAHFTPDFRYGTVRFSLNTFTGMIGNLMLVLGALVPGCLFIEERKNGVMKTVIASGLSRERVFIGKCIAAFYIHFWCFVLCLLSMWEAHMHCWGSRNGNPSGRCLPGSQRCSRLR